MNVLTRLLVMILLALIAVPAWAQNQVGKISGSTESKVGTLVLFGGPQRPETAVKRFAALAGGSSGKIVVIPYAGGVGDESAEVIAAELRKHTQAVVVVAPADTSRIDAAETLSMFNGVTGIFFAGGDAVRLVRLLRGSRMLAKIQALHTGGAVVAGLGGGASALAGTVAVMPAGTKKQAAPAAALKAGSVATVDGLGLVHTVVFQHQVFEGDRQTRLLAVTLEMPWLVGVGLSNGSAILLRDGVFEVAGEGPVLAIDAMNASISKRASDQTFSAYGVLSHILVAGERFSLRKRQPAAR